MKKYIVLTFHGFTENDDMISTDNMQVLGWAEGTDYLNAADNFKKEYPKLLKGYGDTIILYELADKPSKLVFVK